MERALALAFVLLPLASLAAGCTHEERTPRAEYERRMQVAIGHLQQRLGRIGPIDASRPARAARQLDETEQTLDEVADEADAIEPPEQVADEHHRLVDAMRRYAAQLREPAAAVHAGDTRILEQTDVSALDGNADLQAAAVQIRDRGYTIAPPPRRKR